MRKCDACLEKKQPIGTKTTNNTNIFLKIPWIFPKNILIFNPFQTWHFSNDMFY